MPPCRGPCRPPSAGSARAARRRAAGRCCRRRRSASSAPARSCCTSAGAQSCCYRTPEREEKERERSGPHGRRVRRAARAVAHTCAHTPGTANRLALRNCSRGRRPGIAAEDPSAASAPARNRPCPCPRRTCGYCMPYMPGCGASAAHPTAGPTAAVPTAAAPTDRHPSSARPSARPSPTHRHVSTRWARTLVVHVFGREMCS